MFSIKLKLSSLLLSIILLIFFFDLLPISTNIFYKSKSKIIIETINDNETNKSNNKIEIINSNSKIEISTNDYNEIIIRNNFFRKKKINFSLKSVNDGFIKITLTNIEKNKNGINTKSYVQYSDFYINEELIDFNNNKINNVEEKNEQKFKITSNPISTENPFEYIIKVKNNDIININLKTKNYFNIDTKSSLKLIFILLSIFYVISYKNLDTTKNLLSINDNIKKMDIIFVIVIFIFLFFPTSKISNKESSTVENRILTKYQPLFINENSVIKFNKNWTYNFDKFFNDRFRGRDAMIEWDFIENSLNNIYFKGNYAYFKNNNWFMENTHIFKINEKDKKNVIKKIEDIKKFCDSNNIKLYFFIIPNKERIYKEFFFQLYNINEEKNFLNFIVELKSHFESNQFMYPYEEYIKEKKNDYIFPKPTHHLSDYGTYINYKIIIKLKY